jgi:hyperosmotically inducible protein
MLGTGDASLQAMMGGAPTPTGVVISLQCRNSTGFAPPLQTFNSARPRRTFIGMEARKMKSRLLGSFLMAGALVTCAALASAADKTPALPKTDAEIIKSVLHQIRSYPYYTLWDDIEFRVSNGQVELMGAVTQPVKKSDIDHIVAKLPGVTGVTDNIEVLPLSSNDDLLRRQVAAALFREPVFRTYATEPVPAIHIIVDNGRVTLTGVVANDFEKNLAGIRASAAGLSFGPVVNNLRVESPSTKKS